MVKDSLDQRFHRNLEHFHLFWKDTITLELFSIKLEQKLMRIIL